jgi:hypothetical protein
MLLPVVDWKKMLSAHSLRVVLIGLGGVLLVTGVGVGGYHLWPEPTPQPPPPETATNEENAQYAAGDDFRRLSTEQRLAWIDRQMDRIEAMDDEEFIATWRDLD